MDLLQQHFDEFFEDVYGEMSSFGKIEQLNIMGNLGEHMVGNVYVLFDDEEASAKVPSPPLALFLFLFLFHFVVVST